MVLTNSVADLVTRQVNMLNALKLSEQSQRLSAIGKRAEDETFRVLFVGEYSRGKSTLINALVERSVLKTSAVPVSTQNVVRYGESAAAKVQRDGEHFPVSVESLSEDTAERVDVSLPVAWLSDRIELIEQPGVSDQPDAFAAQVMAADLVVVVLASDALYSATESKMVSQLKTMGHRDLWFVCSFSDRIAPSEQDAVRQAAKIRLPVNPDRIFFVSAEQALQGQLNESGVTDFRDRLIETIRQKRSDIKQTRVRQFLQQSLTVAEETSVEQQATAAQNAASTGKRQRELQLAYEAIAKVARRLESEIEDYRQRASTVLQTMSRSFVLDLAPQMAQWLSQHKGPDPTRSAKLQIERIYQQWQSDELDPYWHQQMTQQAQTIERGLQLFEQKLNHFYQMLDRPGVRLSLPDSGPFVVGQLGIGLPEGLPAGKSISEGFMSKSIVLAPLAAGALTLLVARPIEHSVPVGAACLFLAAAVAKGQFSSNDRSERDRAIQDYARAIRQQADPVSFEISGQVNTYFQRLQDDLHRLLSSHLSEAQKLSREVAQQTDSSSDLASVQNQLRSIKQVMVEQGVV